MKTIKIIFGIFFVLISFVINAQKNSHDWKNLIYNKDDSWFASIEAKQIAENVLLYQRTIGGWTKNIQMQNSLSENEKEKLLELKSDSEGCTIDNGATCQEMFFLSKIYKQQPNDKYKTAFLKGVMYLISAQYENGGFPQFFPLKKGYASHITYNDDATYNVLKMFQELKNKTGFYSIAPSDEILNIINESFEKGIDCILKTQFKQNGVPTVWCAQHDEVTLKPANARAFELASLSGKESAKLVLLLMSIEKPSIEIVNAVDCAISWFENVKIIGFKLETFPTGEGEKTDRKWVESPDSEPLWARFMELDSNKPFFCDRDGIKKYSIAEIGSERRNGYGWYTNEPKEVLKKYKKWKDGLR